jgi:transcriptional regulator with PAS, ATPase and Fis domain
MELLWLTCYSREADHLFLSTACHIFDASQAIAKHDPGDLLRSQAWSAIVVDVDDSSSGIASKARAIELLAMLRGESAPAIPVWVLDRRLLEAEAAAESVHAWHKAGAHHVAVDPDEIRELVNQISCEPSFGLSSVKSLLIGASRAIQSVAANIELIANKRCNVLIEGETGTGKEVVARGIHAAGSRSRGPWVAVNCGAIPEALLEAELFGHVKGAFTGAVQSRAGKFEAANHGTIFLDEIGEMPLAVQAKLLRVLQEREVERLGGNERIRLDVRVIAATNSSLAAKVSEGRFRQDLYYRINVFCITMPPLRERPADIAALARHFIAKFCTLENIRTKTLDYRALDQLLAHDWPGNVRELENLMETAVILSGSRPCIYPSDLRLADTPSLATHPAKVDLASIPGVSIPAEGLDYQEALHAFEHSLLTQAIARTRGNKTAAADLLRLKRTTLSARMRTLESRLPRLVA